MIVARMADCVPGGENLSPHVRCTQKEDITISGREYFSDIVKGNMRIVCSSSSRSLGSRKVKEQDQEGNRLVISSSSLKRGV